MDQGTDNATSIKTKGRSILQELQKSRVLLQCPSPCTLKKQIADLALKNRVLARDLLVVPVFFSFF
jgi:hypothetical protein